MGQAGKFLIFSVLMIVVNLLAKMAYHILSVQHVDLIRCVFIGLCVTCMSSLLGIKWVPWMKTGIVPATLGVGSAIGEIVTQLCHFPG